MEETKELEQPFPSLEWVEVSQILEEHHSLFYQFWSLGKPVFVDNIKTAAVCFDKTGAVLQFCFNRKFWNSCDKYERAFIIGHEALHVIFNHGYRAFDLKNKDIANIAADLVVNHTLVDNFNFDRSKLKFDKDLCWVDTIFKPKDNIAAGLSLEEYIIILNKLIKTIDVSIGSIDDHSGLPNITSEQFQDIIEQLDEKMTPEEKESIQGVLEDKTEGPPGGKFAGVGTGGWSFVNVGKVKKKQKWETVIKKWSQKYNDDTDDVEQWTRKNRRIFLFDSGNILLPSEIEHDKTTEGKINVFFFQDTSGSCWHLKDRFFKAARSLPEERFNVRMFCFDTNVFETDINSNKIYGGGGTSFSIIESRIQKLIRDEKINYPEAVFVISDGYGTTVNPQFPKKWYWFLSVNYTHCIPKESNIFMLQNYE